MGRLALPGGSGELRLSFPELLLGEWAMIRTRREGKSENAMDDELVFAFDRPHRVGTVCGFSCEQCAGDMQLQWVNGEILPDTPLYIMAEATEEDWRMNVRSHGGRGELHGQQRYFYFVTTD